VHENNAARNSTANACPRKPAWRLAYLVAWGDTGSVRADVPSAGPKHRADLLRVVRDAATPRPRPRPRAGLTEGSGAGLVGGESPAKSSTVRTHTGNAVKLR